MSIPRPEDGSSGADPFGTDLIGRIANEFYGRSPGAGVPEGIPTAPVPSGVAGFSHPAPSSSAAQSLSGGYPSASPATPPVHPILDDNAPAPAKRPAPSSGAHNPDSRESYAFGEPRLNGRTFGKREVPAQAGANPPASFDTGGKNTGLPGIEIISSPEYYFIDRPQPEASTRPEAAAFDVDAVRDDFPILHQDVNGHPLVWLDNAATTQKPRQVIDATSHFYSHDNSNIHRAAYELAERATKLFEAGRDKVRQFLGARDAKEIVFLRGTTEAINLVAQSYGRQNVGAGDEIILTELEHHANIVPWQILAQQTGATIRVIPINDRGELVLEEYAKLLSPRTKIVSVAHVSNSLGTVNPVEEIIALAHAHGAKVLVDGAQSTPHLPVNVSAIDADFFVFSGHKVFAPTGIGALYGKSELLQAMPPWQGGGHMIRDVTFEKTVYQDAPEKFEAGTPDIAGVVGLGAAIDYLFNLGIPALAAYEHSLLDYATQALATVPGLRPIGTASNKASVLSFVIPGIPNDQIAKHLDRQGIAVRAGHHCALPAQRHFGLESTVRPSLAFYNTRGEVDRLVQALHGLPRR
jgi:SufS family cysteine desulfurase